MVKRLSTLLILAATGTGCGGDAIFIRQAQRLDASTGCDASTDPNVPTVRKGKWDLLYADAYEQTLLVGTERGDRIQIQEVDVTVFDYTGSVLSTFVTPGNGVVDPSEGEHDGFGLVDVTLVDSSAGAALQAGPAQTIVSRVQVLGTTAGGSEVVSEVWDFPIDVCQTTADAPDACLSCAEADEQVCRLGQEDAPGCAVRDNRLGD